MLRGQSSKRKGILGGDCCLLLAVRLPEVTADGHERINSGCREWSGTPSPRRYALRFDER